MVFCVGSPKSPGVATAIEDYESRLRHYFRFHSGSVRARRISRGAEASTVIEDESQALLRKVPPGLEVVAVDERGTSWRSQQLADYLGDLALRGRPGVAFLVGGTLGLSEKVRSGASRVLALSRFTLPHELARLVLLEQLYRAGTIQRGEPYHRGG